MENAINKIIMCQTCAHKNVCKKINEQIDGCEDFLNSGTYKIYGNIYDMFQPIFDWLNFHHPHGDVKFVVDNMGAKMYQEHGPFVSSKQLDNLWKARNPGVQEK